MPAAAAVPAHSTTGPTAILTPLRVDPALLGGESLRRSATAAAPTAIASSAVAAVPRSSAAVVPQRDTARVTATILPPLRVDPALLGGQPIDQAMPPLVADAPAVPPLYSAHVAAGLLPPRPAVPVDKKNAPTHITARRMHGVNEVEMVAEGAAELQRATDFLRAERIVFRQDTEEVEAVGNVHLLNPDSSITGPRLRMRMSDNTGEFESPNYLIRHQPPAEPEPALTILGLPVVSKSGKVLAKTGRNIERPAVTASGGADRLEFRGEEQYHLENATYSTCEPGRRDWEIRVSQLDLDYTNELGDARDATLYFKDTPLFHTPWLNFSLNNRRKSGLLAPTIGSSSKSGFEFTVPWYWNIAPDMDATIAPRLLTKRGVQFNTELRYLDPAYKGTVRAEYLPGDRLADMDRYGYSVMHTHSFGYGLTGTLNLNHVSDDKYFSDLSTRMHVVSQGNLLRQGVLNYAGPWYGGSLLVQSYQTLQDPDKPPLPTPYSLLPQVRGQATRHDLPLGLAFNLQGEYANFDHPTLILGRRTTFYPQLSLPLMKDAFWLTPKVGFHSTRYELDRNGTVDASQSRGLPIASLDGGFTMERNLDWFGRDLLQTLEPRAYYLYVPKRDQGSIPVFDTALADFNYAQMFSENRYAGGDRMGDANQLTLALTSRMIDPGTGVELLRATLGQRYYFKDPTVTLPGETLHSGRAADLLAAVSGQVMPKVYADFGWQYNPRDAETERLTLGGRYQPMPGKVLNTTYRYARDQFGQVDVSGQWPLGGPWHGVGRFNYSTRERRPVEVIGGLEYNGGCWVGRFVVQRIATLASDPSTAMFVQIELNDLSRIGSNPLDLLRRNIPGYGVINQPTADPVFGTY